MKYRREDLPTVFPANIRHFINHRSGGRSHWHKEIELQLIVSGEVSPTCDLRTVELAAGDILFVNSNELHAGNNAATENEFYCFHINTEFFNNHIGDEHIVFENVIRDVQCTELLKNVIACNKENNYLSRIRAARLLYEFFEIVSQKYVKEVLSEVDFKKHFKRLDKFNDIVKFIEDHSCEPLSINTIAEHFYITPSYLSHFFKKRSGKSVIQYLNQTRICNAKRLLEEDDLPIGEIAGQVGFDDINYFSRKFRQLCGETPTAYRDKYRRT